MRESVAWDDVWMHMAHEIARMRSKDPEIQVGAVVVSPDNSRMAFGYNGFARGIKDTPERWQNDAKKDLVIHGEDNALNNANTNVDGWTLYVTLFPCLRCTISIIHRGVRRVVYREEPKKDSSWNKKQASLELFKEAGVTVSHLPRQMNFARRSIRSPKRKWLSIFKIMWPSSWRRGTR